MTISELMRKERIGYLEAKRRCATGEQMAVGCTDLDMPHRGLRCGMCYWALYDGEWCQNKDCQSNGKEPPHKIKLTNAEAAALIEWQRHIGESSDGATHQKEKNDK